MALPKKPVRKKKPAFEGSGEITAAKAFTDAWNKAKAERAAKIQGKDGEITLGGKKVATKTEWSLNRVQREYVDASVFGDLNKTYLAGDPITYELATQATTSGGGTNTVDADTYARDYIRKQVGDLQADNHRLMQEKKQMQEVVEQMRDILRVAAERMGGEFIALESELNANDDRIVISTDDYGNEKVTVIPEWVRMEDEEGNLPVDLLMPHDDDPSRSYEWGVSASPTGATYKLTGTFTANSSTLWEAYKKQLTEGMKGLSSGFEPLSDKSQTK